VLAVRSMFWGENFVKLSNNFVGLNHGELLERYVVFVWKDYKDLYERLVARRRIYPGNLEFAVKFIVKNREKILGTKNLVLDLLEGCLRKVCSLFEVTGLDVRVFLFVGTLNADGFTDTYKGEETLFIGYKLASLHYPRLVEVFLCHELTHFVHGKILSELLGLSWDKLFDDVLDWWFTAALIWEGLATFASKTLVPRFSDREYLACYLPSCGDYRWFEESRELLLKRATKLLDVRDFNVYREYFMGGGHPKDISSPRTGYYVGYLVIEKLVRRLGFSKLVRLHPSEWKKLIANILMQR